MKRRPIQILLPAALLLVGCVATILLYQALSPAGVRISSIIDRLIPFGRGIEEQPLSSASGLAVLGLGLFFGLKHATEIDHVVAVYTIVSEQRNVGRAALIGGL
jgi:hypothetical protein